MHCLLGHLPNCLPPRDIQTFGCPISGRRQHSDATRNTHSQPLYFLIISHGWCSPVPVTLDCPLPSSISASAPEFPLPGQPSRVHHPPARWPDPSLGPLCLKLATPLDIIVCTRLMEMHGLQSQAVWVQMSTLLLVSCIISGGSLDFAKVCFPMIKMEISPSLNFFP